MNTLNSVCKAKLSIWKQRSKIKAAIHGDENTRYFHACANQRRRKNRIQIVEHNGVEYHSHERKADILHVFYQNLMGTERTTTWAFDLDALYPEGPLDLSHLGAPFSYDEIKDAIHRMHADASPGPDGFGPLFFKSTWPITSHSLVRLFKDFYLNNADLSRINTSYLVLLPKKNEARNARDFRPIALLMFFAACSTTLPSPLPSATPSLMALLALSFSTPTTPLSSFDAALMLCIKSSTSLEYLNLPRASPSTTTKRPFCLSPSLTL
jgi:hypothetical protein